MKTLAALLATPPDGQTVLFVPSAFGVRSAIDRNLPYDPVRDLAVPQSRFTFGVVEATQAMGDLEVLNERGRRALRVHLGADVATGLARLERAIDRALG